MSDKKITCWCGAEGTFDELFVGEVFNRNCGGTGYVDCKCGGDNCVCHHHGEVECDGCQDCDPADADDDYDGFDYQWFMKD